MSSNESQIGTLDHLESGLVIGSSYELVRPLGQGGFGQVWLARDIKGDELVAIKLMPGTYATDRGWYEAQVMRHAHLDGVVRLLDEGRDLKHNVSFLVMNHVDGEPFPGYALPVAWDDFRPLWRRLIEILDSMHQRGILHLDLKPENVLVDRESQRVTVLDFGLSRQLLQGTIIEGIAGTPAYLSPEQLRRQKTTAKTDIYALGVMAYHALTGEYPREVSGTLRQQLRVLVRGDILPLSHHTSSLPSGLEPLIMSMLAVDPETRPGSLQEVLARLDELGEEVLDARAGHAGQGIPLALLRACFGDELDGLKQGRAWRLGVGALFRADDVVALMGSLRALNTSFRVVVVPPGEAPFESLVKALHAMGCDYDWRDVSVELPLFYSVLGGFLEGAPELCLILEQGEVDDWSWRFLRERGGHHVFLCKGNTEPLKTLTEEGVSTLFSGPELWLGLRSRLSRVVMAQTGGEIFAVWRTLQEWVRLGVISEMHGTRQRFLLNEQGVRRAERGVRAPWEGEQLLPDRYAFEPVCMEILAWVMLGQGRLTREICLKFVSEALMVPVWLVDVWLKELQHVGVLSMDAMTGKLFAESLFSSFEIWSQGALHENHLKLVDSMSEYEPARVSHLIQGRDYNRAVEAARVIVEHLEAQGEVVDAIDVIQEVLRCSRHSIDADAYQWLVRRWASLAMLAESLELVESFLIEIKRLGADGFEDIVELATLLRAQHRRSNHAFEHDYLRSHLPDAFEMPWLELCRLQLFYRAIRDRGLREEFLEEVKPWFEHQQESIQMVHLSWEAIHHRDMQDFVTSATLHEQALVKRVELERPIDALMSLYNVLTMWLNALDYERAQAFYDRYEHVIDGVQGGFAIRLRYQGRRLKFLRQQPLELEPEVEEVMGHVGSASFEGLVMMTEAGIAWQVGALDVAQDYALRAQRIWRNFGASGLELLCSSLSCVLEQDASMSIDAWMEQLAQVEWPRLVVQTCGLLSHVFEEAEEKDALRHCVTQRMNDIPASILDLRLECISLRQACAWLDLDEPLL